MNWKTACRARAEASGVWPQFIRTRTVANREGKSPIEAWEVAAREHLPEWFKDNPVPEKSKRESAERAKMAMQVLRPADDSEFEKDSASNRVVIQWVADCLGRGKGGRKWLCPTAKALYEWSMESPANRADFWTSMFSRLLPSKAQVDQEDRTDEDGGMVLQMIRDIADSGVGNG